MAEDRCNTTNADTNDRAEWHTESDYVDAASSVGSATTGNAGVTDFYSDIITGGGYRRSDDSAEPNDASGGTTEASRAGQAADATGYGHAVGGPAVW